MPDDLTDEEAITDAITDAIASEVVARVERSHPNASPKFRRLLVRLYTLQATGQASPPGQISDRELAPHLKMDFRRVSKIRQHGLSRAFLHIRKNHPEI